MAKITFEIEADSEEVVEIISGIVANMGARRPIRPVLGTEDSGASEQTSALQRRRPRKMRRRQPTARPKVKKVRKDGAAKLRQRREASGAYEAVKAPAGASQNSFRKWTPQEVAWLKNYMARKGVGTRTVSAFKRQFGYNRSLSSLTNKAGSLRNKR